MEEGLHPTSLSQTQMNDRSLIIPPGEFEVLKSRSVSNGCAGSNYVWSLPLPNPNQANSALTYYLHYGPIVDQYLRVTAALLTQILTEPAFNVLRTKEQLGYIVSCSTWTLTGSSERGVRFVVQSEKPPGYLEQRVEAFLDFMREKLKEMTTEELEEHKASLRKKWLEVDKNVAEEFSSFREHVNSGHWDFLRGMINFSAALHSVDLHDNRLRER